MILMYLRISQMILESSSRCMADQNPNPNVASRSLASACRPWQLKIPQLEEMQESWLPQLDGGGGVGGWCDKFIG